jgi:hypothetical protein
MDGQTMLELVNRRISEEGHKKKAKGSTKGGGEKMVRTFCI